VVFRKATLLPFVVIGAIAAGCGASNVSGPPAASTSTPAHTSNAAPPSSAAAVALITRYGCAQCHRVPGVAGNGVVGPSLEHAGSLKSILGLMPNTPANMAKWIENPSALKPSTAMPTLGLNAAQARQVADYLEAHK
jgi:cytochrome c